MTALVNRLLALIDNHQCSYCGQLLVDRGVGWCLNCKDECHIRAKYRAATGGRAD